MGTFHATCAEAPAPPRRGRRALASDFVIYDAADQKRVVTRALKDLDLDEKRYPPRQASRRIHKQKQEARGPDDSSIDDSRTRPGEVYRALRGAARAANAVDFEDLLLLRCSRIAEDDADGAGRSAAASTTSWSTSSRTRTPPSTASCASSCATTEPVRGRRRRPVHLPLARRRRPQHPRLPHDFPEARS